MNSKFAASLLLSAATILTMPLFVYGCSAAVAYGGAGAGLVFMILFLAVIFRFLAAQALYIFLTLNYTQFIEGNTSFTSLTQVMKNLAIKSTIATAVAGALCGPMGAGVTVITMLGIPFVGVAVGLRVTRNRSLVRRMGTASAGVGIALLSFFTPVLVTFRNNPTNDEFFVQQAGNLGDALHPLYMSYRKVFHSKQN